MGSDFKIIDSVTTGLKLCIWIESLGQCTINKDKPACYILKHNKTTAKPYYRCFRERFLCLMLRYACLICTSNLCSLLLTDGSLFCPTQTEYSIFKVSLIAKHTLNYTRVHSCGMCRISWVQNVLNIGLPFVKLPIVIIFFSSDSWMKLTENARVTSDKNESKMNTQPSGWWWILSLPDLGWMPSCHQEFLARKQDSFVNTLFLPLHIQL